MKVAIVHYWLVGMRGGEKVVEALCEMYPQADIFTHVYVPEMISEKIREHRIIPTFINALPRASKMYKTYLPLMPLALEQCDLRGYDLMHQQRVRIRPKALFRRPMHCTFATVTRRCATSGTCITTTATGAGLATSA